MLFRKDFKLKNNAKAFIILGSILVALILIYFFGNFNQFTIVRLSANQNGYIIKDALIIKTPRVNLIKIDNLSYNKKDLKIKNITIDLIYQDKGSKTIETVEYISPNELVSLTDYLKTFRINVNNKVSNEMTHVTKNILLRVKIIDENNVVIVENITLQKNRLSSKGLFYF